MDDVCISRMPGFFHISVISDESVLNETRQHEPGQPVANFNISVPKSVDVCSLHVRISAGNSAGMSAPSEAIEVGKLQIDFYSEYKLEKVKTNSFSRLFR